MSDTDNDTNDYTEQSLDDVLNGTNDDRAPAAIDDADTPAQPAAVLDAKDDSAAAATTTGGTNDATPASDQHEEMVPLTALQEQRKRRQEAERELDELRRRHNAPQDIDPLEDPQGFTAQVDRKVALMRFELQEEAMRERHDDYDEVQAEFLDLARSNPTLQAELASSRNAPKFAYDTAMKARELKRLDSVDDYKSALRKELEAQIRAELLAEAQKTQGKKAALAEATALPSLATVGTGGRDDDVDESLDAVFGGGDIGKRRRRG